MKETYNNIEIDDEYITPIAYKWKGIYNCITKYLNKNNAENAPTLIAKLDNLLKILSSVGNVSEDVVLKTSLYYFLCKHSNFNMSSVTESNSVTEGVSILLENQTNLDQIFKNTKYRYLNKIELANLIVDLNETKQTNDITNTMKIFSTCQTIKNNYKEQCHAGLFNLLMKSM